MTLEAENKSPRTVFMKKVLKDCQGKDFMSRRDEAIIRLIRDTGGQLSEVADLDVADVDVQRRVVDESGVDGEHLAEIVDVGFELAAGVSNNQRVGELAQA